jgi:hypothetical protein
LRGLQLKNKLNNRQLKLHLFSALDLNIFRYLFHDLAVETFWLWRHLTVETFGCGDIWLWRHLAVETFDCGDIWLWIHTWSSSLAATGALNA